MRCVIGDSIAGVASDAKTDPPDIITGIRFIRFFLFINQHLAGDRVIGRAQSDRSDGEDIPRRTKLQLFRICFAACEVDFRIISRDALSCVPEIQSPRVLASYFLNGFPNTAVEPSSASISSNRLYLAMRSLRQAEPVLIWPPPMATAKSAMKVSSVSPLR